MHYVHLVTYVHIYIYSPVHSTHSTHSTPPTPLHIYWSVQNNIKHIYYMRSALKCLWGTYIYIFIFNIHITDLTSRSQEGQGVPGRRPLSSHRAHHARGALQGRAAQGAERHRRLRRTCGQQLAAESLRRSSKAQCRGGEKTCETWVKNGWNMAEIWVLTMAETVVKHEHIMDWTVDLPMKHGFMNCSTARSCLTV